MKLPVVEIAAEVYHFVWRQRRALVERASVPIAICLLVGLGSSFLTGGPQEALPPSSPAGDEAAQVVPTGSDGLLWLTYIAVSLPFLVGWYRLVIDGPQAIAGRAPVRFGRPEGRMLLWMLLIGLLLMVPLAIAGSIAVPFAQGNIPGGQVPLFPLLISVAMFILLIVASLRLSFVFPAIAVDDAVSFPRAWELTKGNSFRLLALAAVVHLPPLVLGAIVQALTIGLGLPLSLILLVDLSISFIIMALGATMYGEAYARLR